MKKKSKIVKLFNGIIGIFIGITKSLTVDLVRNVQIYYKISTDKEEREKIKKHLNIAKKQEVQQDRLKRVERLVYAVYNDPSYSKRDEGEYDLKHLKEEVEK